MGKRDKPAGESPVTHWIGVVLAGIAMVKVAVMRRPATGPADADDGPYLTEVSGGRLIERLEPATQAAAEGHARGRDAVRPTDIPKAGWKDIGRRVGKEMKDDTVPLLAAGTAFYAMLALFPALIALVSIYGIVASPAEVTNQLRSMTSALPGEASNLIITQLRAVTAKSSGGLGLTAIVGILGALWSASSGMKWLMTALSRAYNEKEKRTFVKLRGTALLFTAGAVFALLFAMVSLVALPSVFHWLHLGVVGRVVASVLRWPLLALMLMTGLAVLYRFGPDRDEPKWSWVTPGAVVATVMWLVGSVGFAVYTSTFGKFNQTYGALGAVIVLLLWLYLSALAILVGAEVNAEMEHQTMVDTTKGPPQPMGARQATMADTVGEAAPASA